MMMFREEFEHTKGKKFVLAPSRPDKLQARIHILKRTRAKIRGVEIANLFLGSKFQLSKKDNAI